MPLNDFYRENRTTILKIINLAAEYGAISEQYNDISYGVRKVAEIRKDTTIFAKLVLTDEKKELMDWFGLQYENYLYISRKEPLLPEIYDYYKCLICKAGSIRGIPSADIENAKLMLEWAYSQLKPFDYIFFLCNAYPSYILSIITYIYTKLICMYYFDKESYQIIKLIEIRQNMLFNNHISDNEFNECINLMSINDLRNKDMAMKSFHPFVFLDESRIIICKWMFSINFNLIGDVKDICFNSSASSTLGLIANNFGKNIFEKIVKSRFETRNWNVLNKNIIIKSEKQPLTDIDLIAYKNNLLLLGQIKVAHSGYGVYQKWKAEKSVISGISQCGIASRYFEQNKDYLVSLLKNHKIISDGSEIKQVISVVITSSNFFAGMPNAEDVSVIGIEMLDELLYYAEPDFDYRKLASIIKHPISKYNFDGEPELVYSKIATENFELIYQEIE